MVEAYISFSKKRSQDLIDLIWISFHYTVNTWRSVLCLVTDDIDRTRGLVSVTLMLRVGGPEN